MLINEKNRKPWPANAPWPEPIWDGDGDDWDIDLVGAMDLDDDAQELLQIKDYMDSLVEEGRLNADFTWNEDFDVDKTESDDPWRPEIGIDYWDDGFDLEAWEANLSQHMNCLKLQACEAGKDPVQSITSIIRYSFKNENTLRQAFTRRAFSIEYGLAACNEELEFFGDQILGTVVTREIYKRFCDSYAHIVGSPFQSKFKEGELSRIREKYTSKVHLANRAADLGLDQFILYGTGETPTESAREDMIEALIGAVAVDSDWNWKILEDVIDRLVNLQLDEVSGLIQESPYEQINKWHQKRFGCMPEYEVYRRNANSIPEKECYCCILRFYVPENEKGIRTSQRMDVFDAESRTSARDEAAANAIRFIKKNALWINLADSGIVPDLENSINQLQELYQKKYVDEPHYTFNEVILQGSNTWHCICICEGIVGEGTGESKVKAKKCAAYALICRLMA